MGRPRLPIGSWGAITVTPYGDGHRARARFRDVDGVTREVSAHGPTKGAARSALTARLVARAAPTAKRTFADFAARWDDGADALDIRPQSLERYRAALRLQVLPALGGVEMWEVNAAMIDAALANIRAVSPGVEGTCRTVISHVLRLAVLDGAIPASPMRDVPRRREKVGDVQRLTVDDIVALRERVAAWAAADSRRTRPLLDVVDVLLSTGLRVGELLALRWCDVDLDAGTVTVSGTQVWVKGKGVIRQEETKASRIITHKLTDWAVAVLKRRRDAAGDVPGDAFVFAAQGSGGASMVAEPNLNTAWRKARGDGYESVTWRSFRKAVGQTVADVGGAPLAARVLGHTADAAVTRRHYVGRAEVAPDVRGVPEERFSRAVE